MWTLEFEAPRGNRCYRYGWAITVTEGELLWFCAETHKWKVLEDCMGASTHLCGIKTLKAFKRHLRKHPELRGNEVVWCNHYDGHNVTAKWVGKLPAAE